MPILQNIQIAEQEAEKLRQDAHMEVELLRQQTRLEAENEVKNISNDVSQTIKLNNQNTLNLIDKLEKNYLEKINKEKTVLEKLAKKNQDLGVNYILKQVNEL